MSGIGVTLTDRVSTGPRDGAGLESRGPGAENLAPDPSLSQNLYRGSEKALSEFILIKYQLQGPYV